MAELIFALLSLAALFALAMNRAPLWAWAAAIAVFTLSLQMGLGSGHLHAPVFNVWAVLGWLAAGGLFALTFPRLKHDYVVMPAYRALKGAMPTISETEREALEAGTVGWDAELFSGTPDWSRLRRVSPITLTAEERAFLDGPTEELCRKLNDWRIRHELHDVPEDVWRFVRDQGFLGMLISKEHGGLGFSAQAQSLVLGKISSRSPDGVTIVMVPNSLGPGELIEKYGTEAQKAHRAAAPARVAQLGGVRRAGAGRCGVAVRGGRRACAPAGPRPGPASSGAPVATCGAGRRAGAGPARGPGGRRRLRRAHVGAAAARPARRTRVVLHSPRGRGAHGDGGGAASRLALCRAAHPVRYGGPGPLAARLLARPGWSRGGGSAATGPRGDGHRGCAATGAVGRCRGGGRTGGARTGPGAGAARAGGGGHRGAGGGRNPAEQVRLVPWGDDRGVSADLQQAVEAATPGPAGVTPRRRAAVREPPPPWPGRLPPPPAVVPPEPLPADLRDVTGQPVQLAAPDLLTAPPCTLAVDDGPPEEVRGWAGPWPVAQRWWVPGAVAGSRLPGAPRGRGGVPVVRVRRPMGGGGCL